MFSTGKHSIAECDRCGFRYKLHALKELVVRDANTNIFVCSECFEADHPQNQQGKYPVYDPQAVENPRPDLSLYADSMSRDYQWGWRPVGGATADLIDLENDLVMTFDLGTVTVTVT